MCFTGVGSNGSRPTPQRATPEIVLSCRRRGGDAWQAPLPCRFGEAEVRMHDAR